MKKYIFILVPVIIIFLALFLGCNNNQSSSNEKVKNNQTTQTETKVSNEYAKEQLLDLAITVGLKDANMVIIEASDFECPACRSIHPEFKKTVEKYKDKIMFGYIPYPLSYHPNAMNAALAVEAANIQNKGWEMYELLFEGQNFNPDIIETRAQELGLDINKFNQDRESEEAKSQIEKSRQLLNELGLQGTPTFYINGNEYQNSPTFANLSAEIEERLNNTK